MMLMRTDKQKAIMEIIFRHVNAGKFLSVRELHALLPYSCAYGSFRMSLKQLEIHRIIEKEKAGRSALVKPTKLGYDWFRSG
ncbi:hypothetical protein FHW16_005460 [Phyllobacterium myrsinacearum]|uniref:LexA repressor DNA-binding domain-containing protein n=1 Tax=Phyllobacterium myrsinacearum TaxID=28101 RepID=A0A839EUD3_9HYPH|nr:hypothetical protein [Phyllobacterium myrsinacearum]